MYAVEGGKGAEIALVLEGEFDGGDLGGIAVGEVGDVAFFDFAVLAEGFAEVDGLVGFAVGGWPACAGYMHVHIITHYCSIKNISAYIYIKHYACLHISGQNRPNCFSWNRLPQIVRVNIRCSSARHLPPTRVFRRRTWAFGVPS